MTLGLLRGDDLDTINRRAGEIAAYVCSQSGATPPIPPAMQRAFRDEVRDGWLAANDQGEGRADERVGGGREGDERMAGDTGDGNVGDGFAK